MAGLTVEHKRFGEMPYAILTREGGGTRPYVIVQHGYTGSLDTEIPYGRRFAELGYTALVTEADLHGQRASDEGRARFESDFPRTMGAVVEASIRSIKGLMDEIGVEEAGYFGISMGGFIGFRLASEDPRVKVLCPLISHPVSYWADRTGDPERIRAMDPSLHPERLAHCAVLIQNGLADEVVPIDEARKLFQKLSLLLPPDRCRMIEYPGVGHEVPEAMVESSLRWMQKHLPTKA
ncbi:MAG TPA: alpha/beta fold hydrolase [Fimbriimonas sp.]